MKHDPNTPLSEASLAKHFISWLQLQHWEVYQEVQIRAFGTIADIVAVHLPLVWVIECKLNPGFRVIEQAHAWLPHAHLVSVAVPWISAHRHRSASFESVVLRHFGIGRLVLEHGTTVREYEHPAFNRKARIQWVHSLTPQQKSFASAGNQDGLRWTPFVETRNQVTSFVVAHPGCSLKDLLGAVKTHYRNPNAAYRLIPKYVEKGIISTVRIERQGRKLLLFPVTTPVVVS